MVAEKSNEIPAAPELIEGLGLKGCVFTLDAEHAQKNRSRVIASGNHLLTQVKDNQTRASRRLELGVAGHKPTGTAKTETAGRNRWETRELTVFPPTPGFRDTPWEKLIEDRASVGTNGLQSAPGDWTLRANDRGRLLDLLGFKPNAAALERMESRPFAIRRQPLRARHRLCQGFQLPASARPPTSPLACDPSLTT